MPEQPGFNPEAADPTPAERLDATYKAQEHADNFGEISETAKMEVVLRFVEQNPDDPLAKRITKDFGDLNVLVNPKGSLQRLEAVWVGPHRIKKGVAEIGEYYSEIAKRFGELGEPDAFGDLHRAETSSKEATH